MTELTAPYIYSAGYIILPVPMVSGLPETLEVHGITYQTKQECHCSLVAVKNIIPLVIERDGLSHDAAEALVMEGAINVINTLKPAISAIGPEFRLADQPERDRHTVIVMATAPALEEVFNRLRQDLILDIPTQIPHITLACVYGLPIGIPSATDLDKYTRLLTTEEQAQLQAQIDLNKIFGATK